MPTKALPDPVPPPTDREFVLSRIFLAPRSLVYSLWTEPKHMARWWGPADFTNPICEMDVRPGGAYRITMRGPDGTDYPAIGKFQEVVPPERLVMTMDLSGHPDAWHNMINPRRKKGENAAGAVVQTFTFEDLGDTTRVTIRTRFESAAIRDSMTKMGMTEGWAQSLVRLEDLGRESAGTAPREISDSRLVQAPRETVFKLFTDPVHIVKWWGPQGFTTTIEEMDLRPGGVWKFVMHGPDGVDYPNRNIYLEVTPPRRIVFHHASAPNHHMAINLADEGGKTRVSMRILFDSAGEREAVGVKYGAVEGMSQTLGRLEELAAKS